MENDGDGNGNGGSHSLQPSSSDSGQALALGKMIMEQMEEAQKTGGLERMTTIFFVLQGNGVHARRIEIQSSEENLSAGGTRNDPPKEKVLQLTFRGEVPDTVCTSKLLESKNGECLKLAVVDSETGEIADSVPESCAEVEIVVLEGKRNVTLENFERRIIKTGEKKKPHFVKRVFITLVNGVGYLNDVKLGQDSGWTNIRKCRLGARIIEQNLYAWTSPFEVIDKRLQYDKDKNKKHYPPFLSSEVWRLERIGKVGERRKRLEAKGIETVSNFLFWYHVDREGLKEILLGDGGGRGRGKSDWEAIVKHAKSCTIDDDQRMFSHKSSIEPQTSVVYSFVGKLKGLVINESHFVRIDDLSADKKEDAHKLLMSVLKPSAFVHRYETVFNDEASLLQQYPLTDPQNSFQENEMSSRPSTTNSFQENGAQDSETFISMTDIEISYGATGFQGSETFFYDEASFRLEFPLTDPQNFDGATTLDPVLDDFLGLSSEDLCFQTSLPSELLETNAGASENVMRESRRLPTNSFEENDFGATSFTDQVKINAHACGSSASSGFFVGVEDEIEQLHGASEHVIGFSTRSAPKGWILMVYVLKWHFAIKKNGTRKRNSLELPLEEDCEQVRKKCR